MQKINIKKYEGKISKRRLEHIASMPDTIDLSNRIEKEVVNNDFFKKSIIIMVIIFLCALFFSFLGTINTTNANDNVTERINDFWEKYEYFQLLATCYLTQKKRLIEWLEVVDWYCEKNYEKFRTKNKSDREVVDFIAWWEWAFQHKAFCDDYYKTNGKLIRKNPKNCKRFSIWYGTKSFHWETITYEEWKDRMLSYISNMQKVPKCWNKNQKIAILDYQYQFWKYSANINTYIDRCDYGSVKMILYPYGKNYLWGIKDRRIRGYNKFLNKI